MAAPNDNDSREPDAPTQIVPGEGEWPVSDLYRVEPGEIPAERTPDTADTVIVTSTPTVATPAAERRFPVDPVPATLFAVVALLILIGLGAWLLSRDGDESDDPAITNAATVPPTTQPTETTTAPVERDVPNVAGETLADARRTLQEAGFRVRVVRRESTRPPGEVLRHQPEAGAGLAADGVVVLTVARAAPGAPSEVTVPDVTGQDISEASAALRDAGLRVEIRFLPSSEPAGTVLAQSPGPGSEVAESSVIRLDVAEARQEEVERVDVPDTVGSTVGDARARLLELGLRVRVVRVVAAEPVGTVVRQSPQTGTSVREGTTVTLRVSTGPAKVSVLDVTGLDEASARSELEAAGFEVRVSEESTANPDEDGLVAGQTPTGGSTAREGAVVTIVVARFD